MAESKKAGLSLLRQLPLPVLVLLLLLVYHQLTLALLHRQQAGAMLMKQMPWVLSGKAQGKARLLEQWLSWLRILLRRRAASCNPGAVVRCCFAPPSGRNLQGHC